MGLRRMLALLLLLIAFPIAMWALNGNVWVLVPGVAVRQVDPYNQSWPTLMKANSGKLLMFYQEEASGQNTYTQTGMLQTSTDSGVTWTKWTGSTVVTIRSTAIGSGYSSTPTCTISGNGAGSGATCTASAPVNGAIPSLSMTAAGTGYAGNAPIACAITGGGGSGATCAVQIDALGGVKYIFLTASGSGYTSTPTCTLTGGGNGDATCAASAPVNGAITSYTLTASGSGYVQGPQVAIEGTPSQGAGAAARVAVTVGSGAVTGLTIVQGGFNYTGPPTCEVDAITGSGATCTATFSGGVVNSVTLGAGGSGYQQGPTCAISGGGGSGATCAVTLNYCEPTDRTGCLFASPYKRGVNFSGGITPAGTIVACVPQYSSATTSPYLNAGLWIIRSTDNGVTWATPYMMTSAGGNDINYSSCTGGPMISIPSGSPGVTGPCSTGCLIISTRNEGFGAINGVDQSLNFSYDDGLSWPDRKEVPWPFRHDDETAVKWLGGMNIILFNRRGDSGYSPLNFAQSANLGTTWTFNATNWPCGPIPAGESGCGGNQVDPSMPVLSLPTAGLQWVIFGDRMSTAQGDHARIRSLIFDGPTAMSAPTGFATPTVLVDPPLGPNPNHACYSAGVQTSPTSAFIVYNQQPGAGAQSNLYFMNATFTSSGAPVPQIFAKANMVKQ